jgi:hypothetical protein
MPLRESVSDDAGWNPEESGKNPAKRKMPATGRRAVSNAADRCSMLSSARTSNAA